MAKVHVVGIGALGTLLAHQIATYAPAQRLTLLLKSQAALAAFQSTGSALTVTDGFQRDVPRSQPPMHAEAEAMDDPSHAQGEPITTLISTLKCTAIPAALKQLSPRLDKNSTVVLIHNGMGVWEQLVRDVWPDSDARPALVQGVSLLPARSMGPCKVQVEGRGGWLYASIPTNGKDTPPAPDSLRVTFDVLSSLAHDKDAFCAPTFLSFRELQEKQLHKLQVNAVINTLTALFDVRNDVTAEPAYRPLVEALIGEISAVFLALKDEDGAPLLPADTFAASTLTQHYWDVVIPLSAKNRSSMLQDIDSGRTTEVDFISGHIVRLAGGAAKAPLNARIHELITMLSEQGRDKFSPITPEQLRREFAALTNGQLSA